MKKNKKITVILILAVLGVITAGALFCLSRLNANPADPIVEIDTKKTVSEDTIPSLKQTDKVKEEEKDDPVIQQEPAKTNNAVQEDPQEETPDTTEQKKSGHYEERQVLVKDAWDEKILVRKGECEAILVKDAYDEEVWEDGAWYGPDSIEAKVCNGCGEIFYDSISQHMAEFPEHGGWHNEMIAQGEPYWHGNSIVIHHDAVYETVCEEDEYEIVHHDAEYETVSVWIED